ncbi:MAG: molybdenum cofactor biosynthesis protein MoaE [Methanospirillum sp.]
MDPYIDVQEGDIDIGALVRSAKVPGTGAIVLSDGVVRDDGIDRMELEAYEPVAREFMAEIARKGAERFGLLSVAVVHRVGSLALGENILIVVVSAGHRKEAFAGAVAIIDELKARVPIWKKEHLREGGMAWVEGNAEGLPQR